MTINLAQLSLIMDLLVEAYLERGMASVDVDDMDEYWLVEAPEWTDFQQEPPLSVGSLQDDWAEVLKLLDGEMPSVNDFDRLATLLRVFSERIASP